MPRCQVCQSPHPRGFPKVCLALDHLLEEQFPEEYAQRRDAVQLSQIKVKPETSSSCTYFCLLFSKRYFLKPAIMSQIAGREIIAINRI